MAAILMADSNPVADHLRSKSQPPSSNYSGPRKSDSIRVCARFRPFNKLEKSKGSGQCMEISDDAESVSLKDGRKFNFDRVFDIDSDQATVFDYTARPLVESVLDGYNCTVFAYGQTGSGKTYSMSGDLGTAELRGIVPRIVEMIFSGIAQADEHMEFTVKVSYVEIYLEKLRDLLRPSSKNLRIREKKTGIYIEGVQEVYVGSEEEVLDLMERGSASRAIASTKMNLESSRSHSVFMLTVSQMDARTSSKKSAKLMLVDLAGSEKIRKTEAKGQTLEEAKMINQSLSALGNVINALSERRQHVPYRNSKLTRLLSDSIGGNSKTTLVVTCSPSNFNAEETLGTLRFGQRAKTIKNKPVVNQERSIAEYKHMLTASDKRIQKQDDVIDALRKDIQQMRAVLKSSGLEVDVSASDGLIMDDSSLSLISTLQEKVETLENQNGLLRDQSEKFQDELEDVRSELAIQGQTRAVQGAEVSDLTAKLADTEARASQLADDLAEFEFLRKKMDLMESEHTIQRDELTSKNEDLEHRLNQLLEGASDSEEEPSQLDSQGGGENLSEGQSDGVAAPAAPPDSPPTQGASMGDLPEYFSSIFPANDGLSEDDVKWKYSIVDKCKSLYSDLTRKIAQHVKLQVKYADAQCELEDYAEFVNNTFGGKAGDKTTSVSQLLDQNRQLSRSYQQQSLENERMKSQAHHNGKLLENWHTQMEHMEQAVMESAKIHRMQKRRHERQLVKLQEELSMYKTLYKEHVEGGSVGDEFVSPHGRRTSGSRDFTRKGRHIVVPITGRRGSKDPPVASKPRSKSAHVPI
eukprot:479905_1